MGATPTLRPPGQVSAVLDSGDGVGRTEGGGERVLQGGQFMPGGVYVGWDSKAAPPLYPTTHLWPESPPLTLLSPAQVS